MWVSIMGKVILKILGQAHKKYLKLSKAEQMQVGD